ncbi:PTS mannose/fructose/sorbose/N-acetylgalactosamine transporter subunit IIC [Lacticaseibacillus paracasei]|uniref:PTS mannose/fructose/sorbose/N-acetylgalactosamine transporter subunit IIC n=1 Tax=Lacticaseibacillus paracasei TaxID=1597 RepID=UPI001F50614D|nr:PTS sugar transporter subunit IIC [Lacticaseibacillus paracasei]MCI0373552.1 PTS sugar transporter subunit IIC [Lacticaseibacillus paracasei]
MGLTGMQVILISVLAYLYMLDRYTTQFFNKVPLLWGFLTGLILGDAHNGLIVGAQLQLMSLGVANLGGSSMPDYTVASIISVAVSITTGKGTAAGLAIGLPVGMLAMNIDILIKLLNSGIARRAKTLADEKKFGRMRCLIPVSTFIFGLEGMVPVALAVAFGKPVVESVLNFMPTWFTVGLNVAGGLLPAIGMAMLLAYMPMNKYGYWIIIGFTLAAFLKMPVLGVALFGIAAAVHLFKSESSKNAMVAQTGVSTEGDMEDE